MSEGSAGKVNMAFIAAIVAVATIGGFMFGYDSGVINGTQKGLEAAFDLGKLGIGVNVGAILVGSSIGAFGAGRMADIKVTDRSMVWNSDLMETLELTNLMPNALATSCAQGLLRAPPPTKARASSSRRAAPPCPAPAARMALRPSSRPKPTPSITA